VADAFIKLEVSLPSGRETVVVSQCGTIADLKLVAQRSFGQGFLRLAAPDGRLLDPAKSLRLSGLQDGDSLIAIAFVTWGHGRFGGDSSRVQDQLHNVQEICRTGEAFAAILADGTVVTWANSSRGGDSSRVQDQFRYI